MVDLQLYLTTNNRQQIKQIQQFYFFFQTITAENIQHEHQPPTYLTSTITQ